LRGIFDLGLRYLRKAKNCFGIFDVKDKTLGGERKMKEDLI